MTEYQPKPRAIRDHIGALEKRADFLARRIAASALDLTYDKQELGALLWAIPLLRDQYADVFKRSDTPFEIALTGTPVKDEVKRTRPADGVVGTPSAVHH